MTQNSFCLYYFSSVQGYKDLKEKRECYFIKKIAIGTKYKGVIAEVVNNEFIEKFGTNKVVFFNEFFDSKIINPKKYPIYVSVAVLQNDLLVAKNRLLSHDLISIGKGELYVVDNYCKDESYVTNKDGEIFPKDAKCITGRVDIPSNVKGVEIKAIANNAFFKCKNLTSVIIPQSVKKIGRCAFYGCSNLETIVIPDSVDLIQFDAFCKCTHLRNVYYTSDLRSWLTKDKWFSNPMAKNEYWYKELNYETNLFFDGEIFSEQSGDIFGTIEIPSDSFNGCTSLRKMEIPNSVSKIGERAFNGCIRLQYVLIPNSVTEIADLTFYNCIELKELVFSKFVKRIGCSAFGNCKSLNKVILPDSLLKIEETSFSGCKELFSISYMGIIEQWAKIEKGLMWNYGIPTKVVHCVDGDVPLD